MTIHSRTTMLRKKQQQKQKWKQVMRREERRSDDGVKRLNPPLPPRRPRHRPLLLCMLSMHLMMMRPIRKWQTMMMLQRILPPTERTSLLTTKNQNITKKIKIMLKTVAVAKAAKRIKRTVKAMIKIPRIPNSDV